MAGRLSKKKKLEKPQYTEVADEWLKYISSIYNEYRLKYLKMAQDLNYSNVTEDLINDTIICCYNSIARNNLSDTSPQGMKNYLFRAFKCNLNAVSNYDKRKDCTDDLMALYELKIDEDETTYNITKSQLMSDYSLIYILDKVESNFDNVDFHLFRLKYVVPCTYQRLREITGIKDCKKRVVKVMKWLKENLTKKEINNAFFKDFPDFE